MYPLLSQLQPLDIFALLLAAINHDLDHCGISNAALINQGDPLAVKYQKVSPLEQHSIDRALEVLNDESHRTALLQAVIQPNNNDAPVTNNEHNAAKSRVVEIFRNCILAMNISRTVDHEAILTVTSCSNAVPCNSSFNISKVRSIECCSNGLIPQ
ncbi:unnamed protein product [Didymodactylos carnosus]|uniref:PDEase domain-containing protein n=1 Tax=Didymodactylos carnosus TaxID=1234261 RepID=A0A816FAF0_9BILA|nr:unnamed protein product [Didymodactylos carnosus]CAF4598361.1 unnamed protein product [Didymodactylos carnosus]